MLWTAFILGLLGSLHCAGMCGPLVLAVPGLVTRKGSPAGRLTYNAGRLFSYVIIGLFFGAVGQALSLAGFQRWLSFSTGILILFGLFFAKETMSRPATVLALHARRLFGQLLHRRSISGLFLLGGTNGLLPCGLVYIAAAASAASGHAATAAGYMLAFGFGTLPVMLLIPIFGRALSLKLPLQKIMPLSVALIALLLILRGLSLGIPYLSPDLSAVAHSTACH